jgi:acetyl-CoA carboxylase/biotin carboxylase 1
MVATGHSWGSLEEYVQALDGSRVIKKILIANNGMAATKAIMSMREWAFHEFGDEHLLEFVVMASKDDLEANMEFIRLADSYVEVPAGKNSHNYANVSVICEVATSNNVDAVWPGWGHASENPALPRALAEVGITFLGPTAPVMHVLGDKIASTILAQSSKVPCIPWNGDGIFAEIDQNACISDEVFSRACLKSYDDAKACASRIGYPVVLKASEGGGGKGIRKCQNDEELATAWEQVRAEVEGSPIFMMQLCSGARHLEVQLVGDEHGHVVALNGRDCSTQRRFQKIFEEGPPTIAPKEAFRQAEKAAQRLAKSVGYRGAGTVEYLYKPEDECFFFLELNPRLQVEHPVTEGITGVNLPALQLHVGMGIPLHRVPDIRRFYGLDAMETSKIDFIEDSYVSPTSHVIAARVTAENPDDAFRPTSGRIERIGFQDSRSVWAYFSVGNNGAIHDFADSQFGHIFARGDTREHARKALQYALKSVAVVGEIRTAADYLVELADTEAFRCNTIDTAWLDRLIAEKSVVKRIDERNMIFYGACFRAFHAVKKRSQSIIDGIKRGHMPLSSDLSLLRSFSVDVALDSMIYVWQVTRTDSNSFAMTTGASTHDARIREQSDGSLYIMSEARVAKVFGLEEPFGLRLRVASRGTIVFPHIRDPSELRSEFNGKLVRYLHAEGDDVVVDEPFVELEAMKMIMSIRATASGKIHHCLSPGSVVSAGQLLASLDLADTCEVKTVRRFTGEFLLPRSSTNLAAMSTEDHSMVLSPKGKVDVSGFDTNHHVKLICACLRGYCPSPTVGKAGLLASVNSLFPSVSCCEFSDAAGDSVAEQQEAATLQDAYEEVLGTFMQHERFFASLVGGNETQIVNQFKGDAEELLSMLLAHHGLKDSAKIVQTILGFIASSGLASRRMTGDLRKYLVELAALPADGGYRLVKLLASTVLIETQKHSRANSDEEMRELLASTEWKNLAALATEKALDKSCFFTGCAGVDSLTTCLCEANATLRSKAAEAYLRRIFLGFEISELIHVETKEVVDWFSPMCTHILWKCVGPNMPQQRTCYAVVIPSIEFFDRLESSSCVLPQTSEMADVHIIVAKASPQGDGGTFQKVLSASAAMVSKVVLLLESRKCSSITVTIASSKRGVSPEHLHYRLESGWEEVKALRGMCQPLPILLGMTELSSEFQVSPLRSENSIDICLAVAPGGGRFLVSARGVSHINAGLDSLEDQLSSALPLAFSHLERAMLDPLLDNKHASSDMFLHVVLPLAGSTPRDAKFLRVLFDQVIRQCVAQNGSLILKIHLEKITVQVWLSSQPGKSPVPLRLTASIADGWVAHVWDIDTQNEREGERMSGRRSSGCAHTGQTNKASLARAVGSTYIYDFPSLFRIALTKLWLMHGAGTHGSAGRTDVPMDLVSATQLFLENDELVKEYEATPARPEVGVVVWLCTLLTPEYPEGREIVIIGNDVTTKAGSFGVFEDMLFQRASALARERGIPRIHIACNSGARLGVVEELESLVHVEWVDPSDVTKGVEYLYVNDADLADLPKDAVKSHPEEVDGNTRHVLDGILGFNMKSIEGGIGVENLQGSGMIVGETSRAYEETFTLSYVTGRSVGVGAYLNRLAQRTIQMVRGPMILTGYQALNQVLGQQVYSTQDQLGGPHIMVPNGVAHELVHNDQEGVEAILHWLSFVPSSVHVLPPRISVVDSVDRQIDFVPTKSPYDPRHMLAGTMVDGQWLSGFCDEGSFREYLAGWGKTVVVGRGRVGGMPVGVIAVETRSVERYIPADPANSKSQGIVEPQAGQVWFPDSAYKTATAIRDFNRGENLPLIIFANWRGFSGGTRDMFSEILKFGAMIVDALVEYKHSVTIYIPPNGELRGGAWVVLDPSINPTHMEMFADVESRGGILEPPAVAGICFRHDKLLSMMHRLDKRLQDLDAMKERGDFVARDIEEREKFLLPVYRQISELYCDLHDRSSRMKRAGVISEELRWRESRTYLHWRIRRRSQEIAFAKKLLEEVPSLSSAEAKGVVDDMSKRGVGDRESDDKAVAEWLETHTQMMNERIAKEKCDASEMQIFKLVSALPASRRAEVVRDLQGYTRVLKF